MKTMTADEAWGTEHDWLATDSDGHVAFFSTAGGGYPPRQYLRAIDDYDSALAALFACPTSCAARFAPRLRSALESSWLMAAERGLFAFDGDISNSGPYKLCAAPMVPTLLESLPPLVTEVAARIRLAHLKFTDLSTITETMIKQVE